MKEEIFPGRGREDIDNGEANRGLSFTAAVGVGDAV